MRYNGITNEKEIKNRVLRTGKFSDQMESRDIG